MFNRLSCFDSIRLMYHQISSFVLFSLSLSASLMNICSIRLCEIFYKAEINPRIGSSLNLGLRIRAQLVLCALSLVVLQQSNNNY